jgi:hypothetical protein
MVCDQLLSQQAHEHAVPELHARQSFTKQAPPHAFRAASNFSHSHIRILSL